MRVHHSDFPSFNKYFWNSRYNVKFWFLPAAVVPHPVTILWFHKVGGRPSDVNKHIGLILELNVIGYCNLKSTISLSIYGGLYPGCTKWATIRIKLGRFVLSIWGFLCNSPNNAHFAFPLLDKNRKI